MADDFDLIIENAACTTASDHWTSDLGIRGGRIEAIGRTLGRARRVIDANGRPVLPGGVDAHCHIDQMTSQGLRTADDFTSGTVSAAFGGTTTILSFAVQQKGESLRAAVDVYHQAAAGKAVTDYAFHMIVTDPSAQTLGQELPALIRNGHTSIKIYMTYDALRLNDRQVLDVLDLARREGAVVMVHAESHDLIAWMTQRLLDRGDTAPRFHSAARPLISEREATHRAITMAEMAGQPLYIVHVSGEAAMDEIARAQGKGLRIFAETCPQYLLLTSRDLDRPGFEGAKYCCTPPPRDVDSQRALWRGLATGIFNTVSSDHSAFRFNDPKGKLAFGQNVPFNRIPQGVPGLEARLPLLFSEGVSKGRITLHQFVSLTATEPAKIFGLYPRKGTIAVGCDADLAIWDPEQEVTIRATDLHDATDYTPYEGMKVTGWPSIVLSRGDVVCEEGVLKTPPGRGEFLHRLPHHVALSRLPLE
jgi:dihydropyrimidinase